MTRAWIVALVVACSSPSPSPLSPEVAWTSAWSKLRVCLQDGQSVDLDPRDVIEYRLAREGNLPKCDALYKLPPPPAGEAWKDVTTAIQRFAKAREEATYLDDNGSHPGDTQGFAMAIRDVDDRVALATGGHVTKKRLPLAVTITTRSRPRIKPLRDDRQDPLILNHVIVVEEVIASAADRLVLNRTTRPYAGTDELAVGTVWSAHTTRSAVIVDGHEVYRGAARLLAAIGDSAHRILAIIPDGKSTIVWLDSRDAGKQFTTTHLDDWKGYLPLDDRAIDLVRDGTPYSLWRHVTADSDTTIEIPENDQVECGTTTRWSRSGKEDEQLTWKTATATGTLAPNLPGKRLLIATCAGDAVLVSSGSPGVARRCTITACDPPGAVDGTLDLTSDGFAMARVSRTVVVMGRTSRAHLVTSTVFRVEDDEQILGMVVWDDVPVVLVAGPETLRVVRAP